MHKKSRLLATVAVALCTAVSSSQAVSIDVVVDDMKKNHEAIPEGVPSYYDWYSKPVVHKGNNPNSNTTHIIWWGQLYEQDGGNPSGNTRVKFRNMKLYWLKNSTNQWVQLQSTNSPNGAGYPEDFQGGIVSGDRRTEGDGLTSARAGCKASTGCGYNFHYFHPNRAAIDRNDIKGIFVTCEAILIKHNSGGTDDRSSSKYLVSMGADYYQGSGGAHQGDIGIGRFKKVTTSWKTFTMHSMSESGIRANPPPGVTTGSSSSSSSSGAFKQVLYKPNRYTKAGASDSFVSKKWNSQNWEGSLGPANSNHQFLENSPIGRSAQSSESLNELWTSWNSEM